MKNSTLILVFIISLTSGIAAQSRGSLSAGPNTIVLSKGGTKAFDLTLTKGDYVELDWQNDIEPGFWPELSVLSPAGKELTDSGIFTLVAPLAGTYKITVTLKGNDEAKPDAPQTLNLIYTNAFKVPAGTVVRETRRINRYDVKIIAPKNTDEGGESVVLIERSGRLQVVLKGESFGTLGFNFADKSGEAGEASAKLFASTPDKTGDGNPDVAIEYYSGGAHCCFTMYFFELGSEVSKVPALSTGDAPIIAAARSPKGGLVLQTSDNVFAYWNVPFAMSPFGDLVLEFRDGRFRPSAARMRKPAPTMLQLQRKAAKAKALFNNVPYRGSDFAGSSNDDKAVFDDAFWSEMIDLIYTGHQDLAWKYLDMVWPATKKGKEIFKTDFQAQLERSQFWDDIKTLDAAAK